MRQNPKLRPKNPAPEVAVKTPDLVAMIAAMTPADRGVLLATRPDLAAIVAELGLPVVKPG